MERMLVWDTQADINAMSVHRPSCRSMLACKQVLM